MQAPFAAYRAGSASSSSAFRAHTRLPTVPAPCSDASLFTPQCGRPSHTPSQSRPGRGSMHSAARAPALRRSVRVRDRRRERAVRRIPNITNHERPARSTEQLTPNHESRAFRPMSGLGTAVLSSRQHLMCPSALHSKLAPDALVSSPTSTAPAPSPAMSARARARAILTHSVMSHVHSWHACGGVCMCAAGVAARMGYMVIDVMMCASCANCARCGELLYRSDLRSRPALAAKQSFAQHVRWSALRSSTPPSEKGETPTSCRPLNMLCQELPLACAHEDCLIDFVCKRLLEVGCSSALARGCA